MFKLHLLRFVQESSILKVWSLHKAVCHEVSNDPTTLRESPVTTNLPCRFEFSFHAVFVLVRGDHCVGDCH